MVFYAVSNIFKYISYWKLVSAVDNLWIEVSWYCTIHCLWSLDGVTRIPRYPSLTSLCIVQYSGILMLETNDKKVSSITQDSIGKVSISCFRKITTQNYFLQPITLLMTLWCIEDNFFLFMRVYCCVITPQLSYKGHSKTEIVTFLFII